MHNPVYSIIFAMFVIFNKNISMCWKTDRKEYTQIKTATKNIPVYKFLTRNGHTPFKDYPIIFEKKLPKVELLNDYHFYDNGINQGYHSYSTSVCLSESLNNTHVYAPSPSPCWLGSFPHRIVCHKGYIPKGTKYYINEWCEIVSETLVVLPEIVNANSYLSIELSKY